jgi:Arc/MetJ-type ribon-helix-helix transcriptional regulator
MNVTLRPETQRLLEQRLTMGQYTTPDDVVHAALLALDKLEPLALDDAALDAIDRAEDQIDRGEYNDWKDVREQVRAKFLGK